MTPEQPDIVTRLRERAGKYDEYDFHSAIELEAAREIHNLRAALSARPEAIADTARLDALEKDVTEHGPLLLHNLQTTGNFRGLGLASTGRSLRKAIDDMAPHAASIPPEALRSGELDMSPAARLKDAEDDVLRLHREKMAFFEEKIRLERELAAAKTLLDECLPYYGPLQLPHELIHRITKFVYGETTRSPRGKPMGHPSDELPHPPQGERSDG